RHLVCCLLERRELDPTRQLAHERVGDRLVVVRERIGQVTRERDRDGEGEAVLSAEHVVRLARGVAFFMMRAAPRAATRVLARGSFGCSRLSCWIAWTTACWVTCVAYDLCDGGSIAHALPSPATRRSICGGVENALK